MALRFGAIGKLLSTAVLLCMSLPLSSGAASENRSAALPVVSPATWPDSIRQALTFDSAATERALAAWRERLPGRGGFSSTPRYLHPTRAFDAVAALPNATVFAGTPEHHNAGVSYNELPANGAETYTVFSRMTGSLASAMTVMQARSAAGGAPGSWALLGTGPPFPGAVPSFAFADQWNPTVASHPAGGFWEAHVEFLRAPAALVGSAPSVIVVNASPGAGAPFPGVTPAIPGGAPGSGYWVDYPFLLVNDLAGNPGPPGLGDLHVAWLEYHDLDGDPGGNGVFFDDPADSFAIVTVSTNTMLTGPVKYPAFSSPAVVLRGAVWPGAHQTHRPSLAVAGPSGTPVVGPGGVYLAAIDAVAGQVMVAAAASPGVAPGWVTLAGPTSVAMTPLPPLSASGVRRASSVSIACDNGPMQPAQVYIVWADYGSGDADILFRSSPDGGVTWQPAVRVNQDPLGNRRDQWSPRLVVNPVTGDLHVTYFDQRTDPSNIGIETWTSTSTDGGLTWSDASVSDAGPTPPSGGISIPPGSYVGDYLGSDVNALSPFGAIWSDGRGGVDQDIFFAGVASTAGDGDGDGVADTLDNCPAISNPDQADSDFDGRGDACDLCPGFDDLVDSDGDGVPDGCDVCAGFSDLADADGDGVPDSCDICPGFDDATDADGDAVPDGCDTCPAVFNTDQGTTIGLTGDVNQDGNITSADIISMVNFIFKSGLAPEPCEAAGDVNCSGNVTSADIIYLVNYTFKGGQAPCDVCAALGLLWSCP